MQKKYLIAPGIIVTILVASLLALSSPKTAIAKEKATCCKKMMKKCPYQKDPAQTSLENLSNQFILLPLY